MDPEWMSLVVQDAYKDSEVVFSSTVDDDEEVSVCQRSFS